MSATTMTVAPAEGEDATGASLLLREARAGLDRIEATYDAGVLRLVVPVAEKAKPRKIEISGVTPEKETAAIES